MGSRQRVLQLLKFERKIYKIYSLFIQTLRARKSIILKKLVEGFGSGKEEGTRWVNRLEVKRK